MREAIKKYVALKLGFSTVVHISGSLHDELEETRKAYHKAEVTVGMDEGALAKCIELGMDCYTTNSWKSNLREAKAKRKVAKRKYEETLAAYRDFQDAREVCG